MDFDWTEEQRAYHEAVVDFARRDLADGTTNREARGEFPREAWQRCAAFGLPGLPVPTEYGGAGADAVTIALALEALGYGCPDNGLIFSLNAQMWAFEVPLVRFGSEQQKRRYLPGLCDGSLIAAQAMTEPGSGSDAFGLATKAEPRGEGYALSGSKIFVTNGPVADVFLVYATTDPGEGLAGLCAFLIERGTPGLSVGPPVPKLGLRTSPISEVSLDACEVSADGLLGRPGAGMAVFSLAMQWERSLIFASAVGTMQRQLERCVDYARERRQFGTPIGKFQAVSHRIADMKVRLETARLVVYRLAWLLDREKATPLDAALAKLHVSESYLASSLDALQLHGGYGYIAGQELERDVRDAIGSRIHSGTSDIQRNVIAGLLGL
jgi:alkylation response protein AidB-like acyl-CoA dehydrogenase